MRAGEIADLLARSAETLVPELLPNGKRSGHRWIVGGVGGEAGKSCSIILSGPKAGRWEDFATGEHGDLLDLWGAVRGMSLPETLDAARGYLGIERPKLQQTRRREYPRPAKPRGQKAKARGLEYLTGRGIAPEAVALYRVAEDNGRLIFPMLRDGELVNVKYRYLDEKRFHAETGCEKILVGWHAIPDKARNVVICEGEIDMLTFATWGIPALSVPFGGGAKQAEWIESDFDHLERFDEIYLAMDADPEGEAARDEIVNRLGRERCRIVTLPGKDANECLQAGMTGEQAWDVLAQAKSLDPENLRSAGEYLDDVMMEFALVDNGQESPWPKLRDKLRFREGEVIVVAGPTSHGKSQFVGHLLAKALWDGQRGCVASMEFKPAKWLKRLVLQVAGIPDPTPDTITQVMEYLGDCLWAFHATGNTKVDLMLDAFAYARKRYAVKWFVIDNLSKCGIADDDYQGQKDLVDALTDFATDHDATVFLVHHMRKGDDARRRSISDIKGSGGITDMVDTVLTVWRNKPKEAALDSARTGGEPVDDIETYEKQPDTYLGCEKQREGGQEFTAGLWFDRPTGQFVDKDKDGRIRRPQKYVRLSAVQPESHADRG